MIIKKSVVQKHWVGLAASLFFVTEAQAMESAADYARSENRKALMEVIEQAQQALRSLDNPNLATDERARRNRRERGQPRIVNGRGTFLYPAVGALLKDETSRLVRAWCSGTLIAPDRFPTAAHCVADNPQAGQYRVFFQSGGFFNVKAIEWQRREYDLPKADVAVLTLSTAVPLIAPEMILTAEEPLEGTPGTIVGFGRTGGFNEDYGIKREGFITTSKCPGTHGGAPLLCWTFSAEVQNGNMRSNTCNADSGGPLFVYETIAGHQVRYIAGVTSGGEAEDCLLGDQSYDTDIFHYRDWVQETAGLSRTEPTPSQKTIDPDRDLVGETGRLSEERKEVTFPFDVRSGAQTLMVAMNGDDNGRGRNDFDLYVYEVRAGADKLVCSDDEPSQFAFCRINEPNPGSWKIVVKQKKGRGLVQVVVTQVPR